MKVRFRREFGQDPFGGEEINLERVPCIGEYFQIGGRKQSVSNQKRAHDTDRLERTLYRRSLD